MRGKCTTTLLGHTSDVLSVVQLTHTRIASGSKDNTIKCWDVSKDTCFLTLHGHKGNVTSVCQIANSDAQILGSAGGDATVRIWDTRAATCTMTLSGHGKQRPDDDRKIYAETVRTVLSLADGRICSGGDDKTVKIWDMRTGTCQQTLVGHTDWVTSVMQLDDGRIGSGSYDATIRLWNAETGTCQQILAEPKAAPKPVKKFIHIKKGEHIPHDLGEIGLIYVGGEKYAVVEEIEKISESETRIGQNWVTSLIQLADGRVCSGNRDATLKMWDTKAPTGAQTWAKHRDWVLSVVQLTNGRICSGGRDTKIKVWDTTHDECVMELLGHKAGVTSVIQLTDGRICSGSSDRSIKLWD